MIRGSRGRDTPSAQFHSFIVGELGMITRGELLATVSMRPSD